ncbi:hypothetical protein V9T40_010764 [Parthenolecanium corni]|uniref:Uncharacterized protein n=1 Tax=Parthenolecanium corni TaxID=536013 RepID=A0AAN9T809_9HEMI
MDACVQKRGDGSPVDVALKNAKELKSLGVTEVTLQAVITVNGQYECISTMFYDYWAKSVCTMLELNTAKSIAACKKVGW